MCLARGLRRSAYRPVEAQGAAYGYVCSSPCEFEVWRALEAEYLLEERTGIRFF